jgi:D-alanyl-lipoteichoic acid acyltransferase DltB (MBOAT superfamily)
MLFNSFDFAIFLPIVFVLYWFVMARNLKLQNLLIVVASYVFYGWWDWRFLSLILFSTLTDYWIAIAMDGQNQARRKTLLWVSIFVNLGFLGFFKYYNFFVENFVAVFSLFGKEISPNTLNIILPVGISFYTFQTLSYTIDVCKGKLQPTRDFIAFAAFVSFFPQLVAGPIERATNLLVQFQVKRHFDYNKAVDGLRQILWGFFKKMVIADNAAEYVNMIFNSPGDYPGSVLFLGVVFFAFQIYGDFSGYSDIAIGTARLFGISLMQNFAFPYFSRDMAEFWRRWHISLSTWFRDYLYIPLGGSRGSLAMKVRNTFIIFVVSGFWHGANWTFIVWGVLNALYFLPLLLANKNRTHLGVVAEERTLPSLREIWQMSSTFALTVLAWVFFRAENMAHAFSYLKGIFSKSLFTLPKESHFIDTNLHPLIMFFLLGIFIMFEWFGRRQQYAIEIIGLSWKRPFRYVFYYILIIFIFLFGGQAQEFIYFQF